jgi:hypothetical protein
MRAAVNHSKALFAECPDTILGGTVRIVRLRTLVTLQYPHTVSLTPLCTVDYQSSTETNNGSPMTYAAFRKDRPLGIDLDADERRGTVRSGAGRLRSAALSIERQGRNAALLLDIPSATVAAWKAHASRGTYERDKDAV